MRHQGKITHWKDEQGFGFISPDKEGEQVFVHIKSFANRQRRPVVQEAVSYEINTDAKGRKQAQSVIFVNESAQSLALFEFINTSLILVSVFLGILAGFSFAGKLPFAVPGIYAAFSLITFAVYALDKSAARKGQWRTAESTLHLFALIGGWPGALLAQRFLRHKSRKLSFQIVFWLTIMLNCAALIWLFSPEGAGMLRVVLTIFGKKTGIAFFSP